MTHDTELEVMMRAAREAAEREYYAYEGEDPLPFGFFYQKHFTAVARAYGDERERRGREAERKGFVDLGFEELEKARLEGEQRGREALKDEVMQRVERVKGYGHGNLVPRENVQRSLKALFAARTTQAEDARSTEVQEGEGTQNV